MSHNIHVTCWSCPSFSPSPGHWWKESMKLECLLDTSFIVTCGMNNYQNTGLLASCIIPPIPALFLARGAPPSPHTRLKLPLHLSCVLYCILCPLSPHAQGAACPLSWTGSVMLHSSSAMDSCQTLLQLDVATVSFMTPNRFLRVQLIEFCFLWLI